MEGRYVKALYDFNTGEASEIDLLVGDVVKVIRQVDTNWLCGLLNNKSGNFPSSFVEPLDVPSLMSGEKLFHAMRTFPAEESGDLGFSKGEIVLGLESIDTNWWKGRIGDRVGIFPITHVRELDVAEPTTIKAEKTIRNVEVQGERIAVVRAIMDLTAQLDDELSFVTGDIIHITRVIDEDFAIGECGGRKGEIPLSFVEVVEGSLQPADQPSSEKRKSKNKFRWWLEDEEEGVESAGTAVGGEKLPQPIDKETHQNGIADNKPVQNIHTHRRLGSYTQENTRSYDSDITPYGKTLYSFRAENPNELTFLDNKIVNLIRHVDDQWMEGEIDGKRGIFPTAYVEIIVDCPYDVRTNHAKADDMDVSQGTDVVKEQQINEQTVDQQPDVNTDSNTVDTYALVLYDFSPNTEQELALAEGDTVTILSQLDEHWFQVKHDDGRIGLCPSSYVRVIDSEVCVDTVLAVRHNNNNSPKPVDKNKVNLTASIPSEPIVLSRSEPQAKPKPTLKPKPVGLTSRTKSPVTLQDKASVSAHRSNSVDVDYKYMPNPKPVVPTRRLGNIKSYQKSYSMDTGSSTLDDLVASEMNAFRTTDVQHRSRRSSVTSDYSSIDESRVHGSPTVRTDGTLQSPDETYMYSGTSVGSSMFFASATSPITPPSMNTTHQRSRPLPSRPPPPPAVRQNSTGTRQPPPRPTGCPQPLVSPSDLSLEKDYGPRPIPSRAAPPRPNPAQRQASNKANKASGNLMDFSPEKHPANDLSEMDCEIVADLDKRIAEIQKDLEKCIEAREDMQRTVSLTEGSEHAEAEENIAFYNANIAGLGEEMKQLKASLYEVHPDRAAEDAAAEQQAANSLLHIEEEKRQAEEEKKHREEARLKRHETRGRVIKEIIETERDYLHGLTLTMEIFLAPEAEKCVYVDVETLFGNIDEVIEVSQKLLTRLEGGTSGREFDKQVIGDSFDALKEDLKKVYAPYCRNHDDVIALLEKYEESVEIQAYITTLLDMLRKHITVFDLGSILIKPVQRILKYPLLLNQLMKNTEDDHVDKQPVLNAIDAMTDVAATINEYKRRKDLVLKYRTDRDEKITDKIARLSMHSTKKKLSRMTQRMVGIQTIDDDYNREEKKIMSLEKGVRSLVRDVSLFMEQFQETAGLQESIANDVADYYAEQSGRPEVQQFCTVHNVIASNLFHQFKFDVEGEVLCPLNRLLMMLSGPAKVMKKRHDKLLDYDHAQVKVKSTKDVELRMAQLELNRMKNDYEALNAQLLDDLPRLYDLAIEIVIECIARLVTIQKNSHQKALDEMFDMSVALVMGDDSIPISDVFNIAHTLAVEALSDISFIPRAFNPRLEGKSTRRISTPLNDTQESDSCQSEGQRVYLTQIYPVNCLFRVVSDTPSTQPMDLSCTEGSLVGAIKEGDPMGNKDRWFVDNGAIKGFVWKRNLSPYQSPVKADNEKRRSRPSTSPTFSMTSDLMDLSSPPRDTKPPMVEPSAKSIEASAKAIEAGIAATLDSAHDIDFLQDPDPSEEKLSLTEPGVQSIDWGMAGAQAAVANYEADPPPTYSEIEAAQQPASPTCGYRAIYSFQARTPIEATLEAGQLVTVIMQRDLEGNTEWWLVEANGKQGYAPSNYLYQSLE